jgi:hypothetical protein
MTNNYIHAKIQKFPIEENAEIIDIFPKNLISINVTEECDPLSLTLPSCAYDIEFLVENDIEELLENGACFDVYRMRNGIDSLLFTAIVSSYERKDKMRYSVQCEDYISYLEGFPYYGKMIISMNEEMENGDFVKTIVHEITSIANIGYAFDVEDHLFDIKNGHVNVTLKTTNCREALKEFLFAVNAYAVTECGKVKIKKLKFPNNIISIPKNRLINHEKVTKKEKISKINVSYNEHSFSASRDDPEEIYNFYEAQDRVALIVLEERPRSIYYEGDDGTVIDAETTESKERQNAMVSIMYKGSVPESGVEDPSMYSVYAKKYNQYTRHKTFELNERGEVMDITGLQVHAYGVTPEEKLKKFLQINEEWNIKIIDSYHKIKYGDTVYGSAKYGERFFDYNSFKVGEWMLYPSKYSGEVMGIITKQTYNLNGNVIVKDTVLKRFFVQPL